MGGSRPDPTADPAPGPGSWPLRFVGRESAAGDGRLGAPGAPLEPKPPVRLHREWKGLTAADLVRDELVARLPGQVRSALAKIERGDLAAADDLLPEMAAPRRPGSVLVGPGAATRRWHRRRAFVRAAAWFLLAIVAAGLTEWWWRR
jgi:hypothetical protein